jgi:hypothetical protein
MHLIRLSLLAFLALVITSCSGAGFPKHTGPHGEVTMEAAIKR